MGIAVSGAFFTVLVLINISGYIPAREMASAGHWIDLMHLTGVLAAIGAIFGTVAMLDARTGQAVLDHTALRTGLCGFFGAVAVLIVWAWPSADFHPAWIGSGFVIGAILGWLGWRWTWILDHIPL